MFFLTLLLKLPNIKISYLKRAIRYLEKALIFNGILRAFIESTLIFLISAVINLTEFNTFKMSDKLNILLSIFCLFVITLIPLLSVYLRNKKSNTVRDA